MLQYEVIANFFWGGKKNHTGNNVTMAKIKQNLTVYFE